MTETTTAEAPDSGYFVFQHSISQQGHWDNGIRVGVAEVEDDGTWRTVFDAKVWQSGLLNFIPRFAYEARLGRAMEKAEKICRTLGSEATKTVYLEQI